MGECTQCSGKPRAGALFLHLTELLLCASTCCGHHSHRVRPAPEGPKLRMIGLSSGFSNAGFNRSGGGGYNQNRWGNNSRDNNNSNNRGSYSRAPQQQPPQQQPPPPQPPPQQPPPPPSYSPARNPPGVGSYSKNSNIPGSSASTSTPAVSSYSPPQVRRGGAQEHQRLFQPQVSTPASNPALLSPGPSLQWGQALAKPIPSGAVRELWSLQQVHFCCLCYWLT